MNRALLAITALALASGAAEAGARHTTVTHADGTARTRGTRRTTAGSTTTVTGAQGRSGTIVVTR